MLQQDKTHEEDEGQVEVFWDLKKNYPPGGLCIDVFDFIDVSVKKIIKFPTDLYISNQAYHLYLGIFKYKKMGIEEQM